MTIAAAAVALVALVVAFVALFMARGASRASERADQAARDAATTATAVGQHSRQAIEAAERSRIDAAAPQVVLTDLRLEWPPYVAAPPSAGLFAAPGSWRRLPADEHIVLPRDETIDLYVVCRGNLRNDGASAGRVTFTEKVLTSAGDELVDTFVLAPGRSVPVTFPIRRKIPAWVTDHPSSRPFVRFTTSDVSGTGPVDSTTVFVDATPLRAVPGSRDTYALVPDGPRQLETKQDPRRYQGAPGVGGAVPHSGRSGPVRPV